MEYREFFKLCGFTDDQIEKERPRIDKAFQNMGIDQEAIKRGERRIMEHYAARAEGGRKLLSMWIKEFIALAVREDSRGSISFGMPIVEPIRKSSRRTVGDNSQCSPPVPKTSVDE